MNQKAGKPVILVADDEPDLIESIQNHFQEYYCTLVTASDGDEALRLACEHKPDLALIDAKLPGINGWELCQRIRNTPDLQDTGVIILTAFGQNLPELTAELFGADDRIDKPFAFAELDFKVRRVIAERRRERRYRQQAERKRLSV